MDPAGGSAMNYLKPAFLWLNDPLNWTNPGGITDLLGQHLVVVGRRGRGRGVIALPIGIVVRAHRAWRPDRRRAVQHDPRPSRPSALLTVCSRSSALGLGCAIGRSRRWPSSRSRRSWRTRTPACDRSTRMPGTRRGAWACPAGSGCGGSSCRWPCRTSRPGCARRRSRLWPPRRSRRSSPAVASVRSSAAGFGLGHRRWRRSDPRRRVSRRRARATGQRGRWRSRLVGHAETAAPERLVRA